MIREAISTQNPIITTLAGPGALDASKQVQATWEPWLAQLAAEPPLREEGARVSGWSPVRYDPPKRTEANAREIFALVLDHNLHSNWDRVCKLWGTRYGVLYTLPAASTTDTGDRLRVVLPFSRAISLAEYDHIWHWASVQAWSADCPVDPETQDAIRFWPDPVRPPGGWRSQQLTGSPLDPDAILAEVDEVAPRGGTAPPSTEDEDGASDLEELDLEDTPSDGTSADDSTTDEPEDPGTDATPSDTADPAPDSPLEEPADPDTGATPEEAIEPACEPPPDEPEPAIAPA